MSQLCVNDIFVSVDGEVTKWGQGGLTTFVRFQGCNLRCPDCDTPQAISPGERSLYSSENLYKEVTNQMGWNKRVTLTGGEPFWQNAAALERFLTILDNYFYRITIETNGTIAIPDYVFSMGNVSIVLDLKVFDQALLAKVDPGNLNRLRYDSDFVKVVVGEDMERLEANIILIRILATKAKIAFAPLMRPDNTFTVPPHELVDFMSRKGIAGILNLQLHKFAKLK